MKGKMHPARRRFLGWAAVLGLGAAALSAGHWGDPVPHHPASTDPELDRLHQMWQARRFGDALPALRAYRRGPPERRTATVDYLIGTSACRVPGQESLGRKVLSWTYHRYRLDARGRESVAMEINRCPPPTVAIVPMQLVNTGTTVSGGVRGKNFYLLANGYAARKAGPEHLLLVGDSATILRRIPADELERRLFTPDQAQQAVAAVRALAGPGTRVLREGPFVVSSRTKADSQLREIAAGLNTYLEYMVTTFGMQRPRHLITVHMAGTPAEFRSTAERIHGLRVPPSGLGYSYQDDLSMVALVPRQLYGTLKHELFHLLVRGDFGDAPAWLDEGIAALFESSVARSRTAVRTEDNWRGEVLRSFDSHPSVEELVGASWPEFDAVEYSEVQQALNHATARYFALYLERKGLLANVYKAMRARTPFEGVSSPEDDAVRVMEEMAGQSIGELNGSYQAWLAGFTG